MYFKYCFSGLVISSPGWRKEKEKKGKKEKEKREEGEEREKKEKEREEKGNYYFFAVKKFKSPKDSSTKLNRPLAERRHIKYYKLN